MNTTTAEEIAAVIAQSGNFALFPQLADALVAEGFRDETKLRQLRSGVDASPTGTILARRLLALVRGGVYAESVRYLDAFVHSHDVDDYLTLMAGAGTLIRRVASGERYGGRPFHRGGRWEGLSTQPAFWGHYVRVAGGEIPKGMISENGRWCHEGELFACSC